MFVELILTTKKIIDEIIKNRRATHATFVEV